MSNRYKVIENPEYSRYLFFFLSRLIFTTQKARFITPIFARLFYAAKYLISSTYMPSEFQAITVLSWLFFSLRFSDECGHHIFRA